VRLQGQTALVTGSTSNIGRAIAYAAVYLASDEAGFVHAQ
jgi:NAD(P)-dependent dehydrogenase (short-subunit alcohol dehydrogenase family)